MTAPGDRDCVPPLLGRTVVITRPRETAGSLADRVAELGGTPVVCPAIRIAFGDPARIAEEVPDPAAFEWVVFTSANAVRSVGAVFAEGRLPGKIAAIGKATAREVVRLGAEVTFQPEASESGALAAGLLERIFPGEQVLLPQSAIADQRLAEALREHGAQVTAVATYRTVPEGEAAGAELRRLLLDRVPDAVLFASPSAVRGLKEVLGPDPYARLTDEAALFSIGPATTRQLRTLDLNVAREAEQHDTEGLVAALREHFGGERPRHAEP